MVRKTPLLCLLVATVALAAWPVQSNYASDCEACNSSSIQNMGYHVIQKVGRAYKFEFSDGTTAYFLFTSKFSSLKYVQVSQEVFEEKRGSDSDSPQSVNVGGNPIGGGGSGYGGGGGITIPFSSTGSGGSGWTCWSTESGVACTPVESPSFSPF